MLLAEYMRKKHPPPTTYMPPRKRGMDVAKVIPSITIPVIHIEMARAFVLVSIIGAVMLPGKWGILSGVVGNAYWLYKIR